MRPSMPSKAADRQHPGPGTLGASMPDPVVGSKSPAPPRSPGRLAVLIALGTLALGYLAGSYASAPERSSEAAPATSVPAGDDPVADAAPVAPLAGSGPLDDLVPGIESRLFVVLVGRGRLELATWFPHAPAASRSLPPHYVPGMDLDAGRSWGAAPVTDPDGNLLHLFRPDWRTPGTFLLDSRGVTSFAWHVGRPGRLAWTSTSAGDETTLWAGEARDLVGLSAPEPISDLPVGWEVRAWGDWGFLVSGDGALRALSPTGETLGERSGIEPVRVGRDGMVLARDGEGWVWSDPELGRLRPAGVHPAPFAWRGDRALILEERTAHRVTLRMIHPGDERTLDRITVPAEAFPADLLPLRWTFDDHLVIASAFGSTLTFVDLGDGSVDRLNLDGSVWAFWVDEQGPQP